MGKKSDPWGVYGQHSRKTTAQEVYERNYGPLQDGWVVHHQDGNHRNNEPGNLILVTKEWHDRHHMQLRAE